MAEEGPSVLQVLQDCWEHGMRRASPREWAHMQASALTHQLTELGFWGLENVENWGNGGGKRKIAGIAHGMWVLERCGGM